MNDNFKKFFYIFINLKPRKHNYIYLFGSNVQLGNFVPFIRTSEQAENLLRMIC